MKKKGFTLIELLAVIIILGVIALIAVPVVMDLIEGARLDSFKASLNNLTHTLEINQANADYKALSYAFPDDVDKINMKGELSKWSGKAKINDKGEVKFRIYNGKYCGYTVNGEVQVETIEEEECVSKVVMDDSLIFMFDNNNRGDQNNVWLDSSGNEHNGTIVGAEWTDDGLSFDGKDDYVDVAAYDTNTITLEVYFKAETFQTTNNQLITNVDGTGHGIYVDGENSRVVAQTKLNNQWSTLLYDSLTLNTFYHIIYTYDGSVHKLYINGNEVASNSATGTVKNPTNNPWALGANPDYEGTVHREFFNGTIHSARLYNRALTAKEVKQNYNATIQGF